MSSRLSAWLRQAHSDLAMAVYASQGGFHAQVPGVNYVGGS